MRTPRAVFAVALAAALLLTGCGQDVSATSADVALGASVERARGHLAAAIANAGAGRWELAAFHSAHPAEDMPLIDRAVADVDGATAATLRVSAAAAVEAAKAEDLTALRAAVETTDRQLAAIPALVTGTARVGEVRYQASVVATLVEVIADEYGEAVEGGQLTNLLEYQDAYAFLQRALATWSAIGSQVAASAPDGHRAVEAGLTELRAALPTLAAPAAPVAAEHVDTLAHDVQRDLREAVGAQAGKVDASTSEIEAAVDDLTATSAALRVRDVGAATEAFRAFRSDWLRIEDAVRGRDRDAYRRIETDMAAAANLLAASTPDIAAADAAVTRIAGALGPLARLAASYGALDAGIILLREGFEALLIIAALLAFLTRSGNADKRRWIWAGGAAGVAASVVVALLVSLVFSASAAAGADPELLEGITGIFAAAMLVYVSFWLHSKASLRAWDHYVRDRSATALARNSVISLAVVAFLAVLREGSETVLFYFGIASSIAVGDLLLGLAGGTAALVAVGVAMLVFGVRVPIRPFFLGTSVLVYYLAFKFIGSGIHALQVAGVVRATPEDALPDIGLLGVFPTWETTVVQIALLAGAGALIAFQRSRGGQQPQHATA